jgi:TatD DNase family protein
MIDTHCHLEFPDFANDRDAVLDRARAAGVDTLLCVGGERPRNQMIAELLPAYPQLCGAYGVHPHWANAATAEDERWIVENLCATRVVALGEIGLDYHYDFSPRAVQRRVFARYLALAREHEKPVILHSREAFADTFDVLKDGAPWRGVVHCFSYSLAEAEAFMSLGLHISFCGQITFPKCDTLREVARAIPLERLLLETDAPFLAPVPQRGKRNEPAWLALIAERHATLRGISRAALDEATTRNACALFGLAPPAARTTTT